MRLRFGEAGLATWKVHAALAIAALAAVVAVTVGRCDGRTPDADRKESTPESSVPPPEGLLGDFSIGTPNATWTKLQRGIGGAVGILPTTLPGVVVALLDLDLALSNELDGTAPIFGALASGGAQPSLAIAMHLVDSRRARGLFADGDTARYVAKDVPGMTLLLPNRGAPGGDGRFAMAITKNGFLLVARTTDELSRLGPYVTRTLPARPLPPSSGEVDVPRSALSSQLKPALEALWTNAKSFLLAEDQRMRNERGRAPDLGDPAAIVAALDSVVARPVAIVGGLEHVKVAIDVTDDAVTATATLTPTNEAPNEARKWIDAMKVGDPLGVLALPAASMLALSTRDSETERVEQANRIEQALSSSLGPRLKEPGKLHDVVESATKARDELVAVAFSLDDPSGLLIHAPVRDEAAANRAVRGAFDLARVEPFKELLHAREVTSTTTELPGLGKIDVMTLERAGARPSGPSRRDAGAGPASKSSDVGIAWSVDQKSIALAAGTEPLVTLKIGAKPERRLADEPALKRFVTAVGNDASTVLVVQPLRLDPKRAHLPAAPLGIALGRKEGAAVVRIDVPDALLREAARWQMGF